MKISRPFGTNLLFLHFPALASRRAGLFSAAPAALNSQAQLVPYAQEVMSAFQQPL